MQTYETKPIENILMIAKKYRYDPIKALGYYQKILVENEFTNPRSALEATIRMIEMEAKQHEITE